MSETSLQFSFWTLGLIATIVVLTVYFQFFRYNARTAEAAPTILTSIGIFGTFLGVAIGLSHFDTQNLQESVPQLLGGLKTAFWSSIAGLLGALSIKFRAVMNVTHGEEHHQRTASIDDLNNVLQKIHTAFSEANEEAAQMFAQEKQESYRSLKLEGILEAPINLCITCDRSKAGPVVLGRTHIKTMDLYSSVCAVQNLWLAARAEGVGVGWMSIIKEEAFHSILGIPQEVVPIAYLCMGYVRHFNKKPELETANWRQRLPLSEQVFFDQWQHTKSGAEEGLIAELDLNADFPQKFINA